MPKQLAHWAQRHGIYFRKSIAGTRKRRFAEASDKGVRYFRVLSHTNEFMICDGEFDRWANSIGAIAPIPRTQAKFDKALDNLLAWSAMRASRQEYWWLHDHYSEEEIQAIQECPNPVLVARQHMDEINCTYPLEIVEFAATLPGRHHFYRLGERISRPSGEVLNPGEMVLQSPLVMFERAAAAAMFKLRWG